MVSSSMLQGWVFRSLRFIGYLGVEGVGFIGLRCEGFEALRYLGFWAYRASVKPVDSHVIFLGEL